MGLTIQRHAARQSRNEQNSIIHAKGVLECLSTSNFRVGGDPSRTQKSAASVTPSRELDECLGDLA
jgi:hypothetical protein